jgi:hypothetical protein
MGSAPPRRQAGHGPDAIWVFLLVSLVAGCATVTPDLVAKGASCSAAALSAGNSITNAVHDGQAARAGAGWESVVADAFAALAQLGAGAACFATLADQVEQHKAQHHASGEALQPGEGARVEQTSLALRAQATRGP